MLILALIGATLFYAVVYILWAMSHSQLNSVESWLHIGNNLAVMPDNLVFFILRGLILVAALYVFGDWLKSFTANNKRRRRERLEKAQSPRLGYKRPPTD